MRIPIISRFQPTVSPDKIRRVGTVVEEVKRSHHRFDSGDATYRNLVVQGPIDNRPTLHLDDLSEVPIIGKLDTSAIVQQRCRLRAFADDWVVQSRPVGSAYSDYCERQLGLGRVHWLVPEQQPHNPHHLALACWRDRGLRHDLIQAVRHDDLYYVHPHMSTLHVWELASMLSRSTRRPLKVIGPTPQMSRWANDKIEFTRAAARLLGPDKVPDTDAAGNFALLAKQVMRFAETHERLGIKYPLGTGGSGNFLVDSCQVRGRSLSQIRELLLTRFQGYHWPSGGRMLIDVWESNVLNSPSVQTWIPSPQHGPPVIEGVFQQLVVGKSYEFIGSQPASLPDGLERQIIDDSYLLALMFQQLGYVGRCSFDLILLGEDVNDPDCRFEFIECNGRWGGTSLPMTLMNRMALPDSAKSWCVRRLEVAGLNHVGFADLLQGLGPLLYDCRSREGQYILFCPARMEAQSSIDAISVAETPGEASHLICQALPKILERLADPHTRAAKSGSASCSQSNEGAP